MGSSKDLGTMPESNGLVEHVERRAGASESHLQTCTRQVSRSKASRRNAYIISHPLCTLIVNALCPSRK